MKLFFLILALACVAFGQGTVSVSVGQVGISDTFAIVYTWTAGADGSVPVTASTGTPTSIQGWWPVSVETSPGTPAPTAGYSVAVLDASGADIVASLASSLSATIGQSWDIAQSTPPLNGQLRLQLTGNLVAGATGRVFVYLSRVHINRSAAATAGTVVHTQGPLTADQPVFGNGLADIKVGTKTGNTNKVVTFAGAGPALGECFKADASGNAISYTCPTGSLTSVAMTGDNVIFNTSVTGSPITTSGTLVPSLKTQTANTILAGPTGGGAATPTFRALGASDLPSGPTLCPTCLLGSSLSAGIVHAPGTSQTMTSSAVVSADLNITTTTCANQFVNALSSGAVGTCATIVLASAQFANQGTTTTVLHGNAAGNPSFGSVVNADIGSAAVTSTKLSVEPTRRTQCMIIGANNASSALVDADLGPQSRQYFMPYAGTLVEMDVAGDAGTPNIILGRSRAGVIANATSAALATASSGGIACSNTGGTTGIDGATTCSATLQNTSWNAGDWITAVSGTAGGTAKEMTACLTFVTTN